MIKDFEDKAVGLINDFCEREYGEGITIRSGGLSRIDVMFTEYETEDTELDDTLSVQVYIDLKALKICLEMNDILVYQEVYGSQKDMLEQLEALDFQAWTNLDEIDVYKDKLEKIKELNHQINLSDDNREQDHLREQIEKIKKELE